MFYSDTSLPNIGYVGKLSPYSLKTDQNFSATGKSTFIKILEEASETEDWEITPEPVSQWTQIDGEQVSSYDLLRNNDLISYYVMNFTKIGSRENRKVLGECDTTAR